MRTLGWAVELYAVRCPRCRRGYRADDFRRLPPGPELPPSQVAAAPERDPIELEASGSGKTRLCSCGYAMIEGAEPAEPWILPLENWRALLARRGQKWPAPADGVLLRVRAPMRALDLLLVAVAVVGLAALIAWTVLR